MGTDQPHYGDTGTILDGNACEIRWFRHHGPNGTEMFSDLLRYKTQGFVVFSAVVNREDNCIGMCANFHLAYTNVPAQSIWYQTSRINGLPITDVWSLVRRAARDLGYPKGRMYFVVPYRKNMTLVRTGDESQKGVTSLMREFVKVDGDTMPSNRARQITDMKLHELQRKGKADYQDRTMPPDEPLMLTAQEAFAGALEVAWYRYHPDKGLYDADNAPRLVL